MAVATKRHLDVSNMFQKPAVTEWVLPPSCSAVMRRVEELLLEIEDCSRS